LHLSVSSLTLHPGQLTPVANMQAGKWLCIELRDSGTGIPPEVLPHIFDPFFTTKRQGLGTGLGLAQVYGIVHQLDGLIKVESQVGMGASFTLYFPLLEQPVTAARESQSPPPRGRGETILLVEDENALRQAMAEMLVELGYSVLSAENGRQALSLFDEHKAEIDLVVSDLVMPDMGGKELYQELIQEYSGETPLRMLLVTGYPRDEVAELQDGKGIINWLQKPFVMELFARRVAETLHAGARADGLVIGK
jgi:CheY-like chemotaxis protein